MKKLIAATVAGLALAAPAGIAHAESQPGDFKARFYGTCADNYVAFWRVEAPVGVDPLSYPADEVDVAVKNVIVKSEVMYPGDYDEVHRYFTRNGIPKTVDVYVDGTLAASHTYACGFYAKQRHHHHWPTGRRGA